MATSMSCVDENQTQARNGGDSQNGSYVVGHVGYVYARPSSTIDGDEWRLLSAKSVDQPSAAIVPLLRGLTVETEFKTNVAAIVATKSSGMMGGQASALLAPTRYSPSVYVFHGGERIKPSSGAPGLSKVCDSARERFGFSAVPPAGPVPNAVETSGPEICEMLGLQADETTLYLVVTELYREAVYLCNTYLHFGTADVVVIGGVPTRRIPLYPVQMHMPDIALRLCGNPFDSKNRSIGEECEYPRPFYNAELNRLLHGAVLGPQGVILRMRNLEALARGCVTLAYDPNYTGCVLSADKTFTQFAPDRGYRGAPQKTATEIERRAACSLSAEIALSVRVASACAPSSSETVVQYDEWPLFHGAQTREARLEALGRFVTETAGIVGGAIFATNSPLYATEVMDAGAPEQSDKPQTGFARFYLTCGLHLAGCSQVDYGGTQVREGSAPSSANPFPGFEYDPGHLAYACGFSPELMSRALMYLERCSRQHLGGRADANPLRFAAATLSETADCEWCDHNTRPRCVRQTLHRIRTRLPIPRQPRRGPLAVIGAVDADYTDCNVLGTFAPYSQLKRVADNEAARAIMHDTYRGLNSRLTQFLIEEGLIDKETHADATHMTSVADLRRVIEKLKNTVESECGKFIANLAGVRGYHYKDHLGSIAHTFSITVNPYSTGYCPMLTLLAEQTRAVLFQDLALSQIHAALEKHKRGVDTKMFRATVLPSLHAAFHDMLDNGFLGGKQEPVSLSATNVVAPDTSRPQDDAATVQYEYTLTRSKVLRLRDFKVKNRVAFTGAVGLATGSTGGDTAMRSRTQGLSEAFLRPGPSKTVNVLGGPLGFILKRDHEQLFGADMDVFKFWNLIVTGHMPKSRLTKEIIDALVFIRTETRAYTVENFIKTQPASMLELANFMTANKILKYCGYGATSGGYYISVPSAAVLSAAPNRDPSAELAWLHPVPTEISAETLSAAAQRSMEGAMTRAHGDGMVVTSSVSNACHKVMDSKPVVLLGVMVSKYLGQQNSTTVFQAANWSGVVGSSGSLSVNACLSNDPVRKMILACRRVGAVMHAAGGQQNASDGSLLTQVRNVMSNVGCTPSAIFLAVLRALGDGLRDVTVETWRALVEDEYLVSALVALNAKAASAPGGWTISAAEAVGKDAAEDLAGAEPHEEMLSFDDCDASIVPANQLVSNTDVPVPANVFGLDETEPAPKRHALTSDVLFC